jgi:transcriptional regulator with PAS, ATPase and Fis domain
MEIGIDVRIVAATNREMAGEVAAGRLRKDLFHRLSVFQIGLPTLAERPDDIEELVWLLIAEFNERAHRHVARVPDPAWIALRAHPWAGNVRELRNVVERCVLLSQGDTLDPRWLQLEPVPLQEERPRYDRPLCFELDGSCSMEQSERRVLEEALRRRGNVTKAARLLGMTRPSMRYRVERLGLKTEEPTEDPVGAEVP